MSYELPFTAIQLLKAQRTKLQIFRVMKAYKRYIMRNNDYDNFI